MDEQTQDPVTHAGREGRTGAFDASLHEAGDRERVERSAFLASGAGNDPWTGDGEIWAASAQKTGDRLDVIGGGRA